MYISIKVMKPMLSNTQVLIALLLAFVPALLAIRLGTKLYA
jgi:photosystem I reaction center subunit XII